MYKLHRNFKEKKMGYWQYKTVGRPDKDAERIWIPRCNFVMSVTATTKVLESDLSGWVVHITTADDIDEKLLISCEEAASTMVLRKRMMKGSPGLIARLTSEDFFEFVEKDSRSKLETIVISTRVGSVFIDEEQYWAFSDRILDSEGYLVDDPPLLIDTSRGFHFWTGSF